MRFPWSPREYSRTCDECGTSWSVPLGAARRRVRTISAIDIAPRGVRAAADRRELASEVRSIEGENQVWETFRRCPKCGCERFTQRASRGRP